MKSVRLLVFVCLALMLASCGFKQTWAIFGTWQSAEGNEVIEFTKDGYMTLKNENTAIKATFKLTDPKHLQIYFGTLATLSMQVSIAGNELTLVHSDGTVTKYVKLK